MRVSQSVGMLAERGTGTIPREPALTLSFSCSVNTSISGATFVTNSCVHNLENILTSQLADTCIDISILRSYLTYIRVLLFTSV